MARPNITGCCRSASIAGGWDRNKHQNVSAVLRGLGGAEIEGHKPAIDFQVTLIDAVLRWILANPAWSIRASILSPLRNIDDPQPLWIGPAPTLRDTPPPTELEQTLPPCQQE